MKATAVTMHNIRRSLRNLSECAGSIGDKGFFFKWVLDTQGLFVVLQELLHLPPPNRFLGYLLVWIPSGLRSRGFLLLSSAHSFLNDDPLFSLVY